MGTSMSETPHKPKAVVKRISGALGDVMERLPKRIRPKKLPPPMADTNIAISVDVTSGTAVMACSGM